MCCKIFRIIDPEEVIPDKDANEWCEHCQPGSGCKIYDARPTLCRDYHCNWLQDPQLGVRWKPDSSKMIIQYNEFNGRMALQIYVDGDYSTRWREEPYYADIKAMAFAGLKSEVLVPTIVRSRDDVYVVLPDDYVEIDGFEFRIDQVGHDKWDVIIP
jgi:hypothetical protein